MNVYIVSIPEEEEINISMRYRNEFEKKKLRYNPINDSFISA